MGEGAERELRLDLVVDSLSPSLAHPWGAAHSGCQSKNRMHIVLREKGGLLVVERNKSGRESMKEERGEETGEGNGERVSLCERREREIEEEKERNCACVCVCVCVCVRVCCMYMIVGASCA